MASPFTVDTLIAGGLDFQPSNRIAILGDGSLLTADTTSSTVTTLNRISNPSTSTPTVTLVTTFTYGGGATTALIADLAVINNGSSAGVDDIWLVLCSDAGAGTTIEVVHGTFTQSGASFAWDTKTSTGVTLSSANSQVASIVWNGINLIVAYRDGASPWVVKITWTATKNGTSGWQAAFTLNTAANSGSHANPMLRHDAALAGGLGGTICLYTNDVLAGHSDQWAARVLLDSAASAASANWKAEVLGGPTGQNVGAALESACVDPANGNVHLVYNSSAAGTGAIGTSYIPVTVSSLGVPSFGTRQLIDTTSGASPAVCVDVLNRIYVFYSSAALNSNSIIDYKTADSPYTTFSSVNTTVFATSSNGDNAPHVPGHDQAISGYVPLFVQRGTVSWTSQFDNTILAGLFLTLSTPLTFVPRINLARYRSVRAFRSPQNKAYPVGATGPFNYTQALTAVLSFTGTNAGAFIKQTNKGLVGAILSFLGNFQIGPGMFWSQETQGNITGGPPGNNTTQTTLSWQDGSGNGWAVGMIPAYGGALVSPRYEINSGVRGVEQTSLSTSNPDGFIHLLANVGGAFSGTEDPTFTLTEIAPTPTTPNGIWPRRYYDSGTIQPSTGPALQYRVRVCFQPGDPGFFYDRIDITNPAGSAVTLAGVDGLEIAMIGGMTQASQGGSSAWIPGNGFYANVGGTETAWPGPEPTTTVADPDYVFITPTVASGLKIALFCARAKASNGGQSIASLTGASNAQITYLTNANRLKIKVRVDMSSFPASTTMTLYYLEALRRNYATGEASSIAADYLNPDGAGAFTTGTFSSYSLDEGAYVVAAATNKVVLTHTFPTNVTKRWLPSYKITSWTATGSPKLNLAGTGNLIWGTDYVSVVDTANSIAYVKLLKTIVASGAGSGQLNNGALTISPSNIFVQALTAVLSFTGALTKFTNKALPAASLSFTGASLGTTKIFFRTLNAILSFTGSFGPTSTTKNITGTLSFTGPTNLTKNIVKGIGGSLSFIGGLLRDIKTSLTAATLSFIGSLATVKILHQAFTATLSFTGTITKQAGKSLSGTLSFTGPVRLVNVISKFMTGILRFGGASTHTGGNGSPAATRLSSLGNLDDTTTVANSSAPLSTLKQRLSNDLTMADNPRKSNSAPESDTVTNIDDSGPMST